MYSGSRGILYTAPPGPADESETETDVEASADAEDGAATAAEVAGGLAADD
ncbi:hypothetical protein [Halosolutus halophilus]|uniref:hypothetical protein n=1 Tax=Halosolutus halophilus TaxID=1552990 RepID=UPI002234F3DD|nr:hypothetical protein [Halosolutus halophilus]